jgi:uncharacterized protein YciU (UPF0263 family)
MAAPVALNAAFIRMGFSADATVAYHFVREAVAMGEVLIGWIKSEDNIADVMTKVLSNGEKRDALIQKMLWDIT